MQPEPPATPEFPATEGSAKALAIGYYVDNFDQLLNTVEAQYRAQLPAFLHEFMRDYRALELTPRRLLVRLLARRDSFFRLAKLRYRELPELASAVTALEAAKLVRRRPPQRSEDWLNLYTKAEWLEKLAAGLLPDAVLVSGASRAELDACLVPVLQGLSEDRAQVVAGEEIIQLNCKPVFAWLKLLYFGNARQDLSEFVRRDLALLRYEHYPLNRTTRLFANWRQVELHMALHEAGQRLEQIAADDSSALQGLMAELPQLSADDDRLLRKNHHLRCTIARQLERNGERQAALAIYDQLPLPPARERRARLLVQLGLPQQALALCRAIITSPCDDDERDFANQFGHRTAAKLKLAYWPKPRPYQPPTEYWTLPLVQGQWGDRQPEWAVAQQLNKSGQSYYVENSLFLGVFALVYWPVYFASLPGAFSHPFQSAPHDLYQPDFLSRREAHRQRVEEQFSGADYLSAAPLLDLFQSKLGTSHRLLHWSALSLPLLQSALQRIPTAHWRVIFEFLWADLRHRRRGLPDLIHFPQSGGYELVEVKGPGDKLQVHQRRWLAYFAQHNIAHRVIHLDWQ